MGVLIEFNNRLEDDVAVVRELDDVEVKEEDDCVSCA